MYQFFTLDEAYYELYEEIHYDQVYSLLGWESQLEYAKEYLKEGISLARIMISMICSIWYKEDQANIT